MILANPPFMSPKGGIRPHNRFSIKAKRSEVLFVDYIAEHLNPGGRAGIIVPEGIIFQSQNAYKALRKMLVENGLWAVVSLPAGVFNPYSGVKTSILFLDRALARQRDDVLFVKVENDGFDLGAQRRPVEGSQLAEALGILNGHKEAQLAQEVKMALTVPRKRILESPDINLSGDRYRELKASTTAFGLVSACTLMREDVKTIDPRKTPDMVFELLSIPAYDSGKPEILRGAEIGSQKKCVSSGDVLLSRIIPHIRRAWVVGNSTGRQQIASTEWIVFSSKGMVPDFLRCVLLSDFFHVRFMQTITGVGGSLARANPAAVGEIQLPLPPLSEQERIVAELEGYRKVIEGARQILASYKPTIRVDPEWEMVKIGDIATPEYGFTASAADKGDARLIRITDIAPDGTLRQDNSKFTSMTDEARQSLVVKGDVLVARTGATYGKTMLFGEDYPAVFASYLIRLQFPKHRVLPEYFWAFAQSSAYWSQAHALMTGGGQPQFNGNVLKEIEFPLPPLAIQRQIVAELEAERKLVEANRELIARMEAKIMAKLAEVWGES